jgi:hypothetical protein
MDREDILVIALLSLLAISLSAYLVNMPNLVDLGSYKNALLAIDAVNGKLSTGKPLYYYSVSLLYAAASQFSAKSGSSNELLISAIKLLQITSSFMMTVSLYFLLRNFFKKVTSFICSVLILSSPILLSNGIAPLASPELFGMSIFVAGLAILVHSNRIKFYPYALIGSIFIGLSILSWNAGAVVFASLMLSVLVQIIYDYRNARANPFLINSFILSLLVGSLFLFSTSYGFAFSNLRIDEFLASYQMLLPLIFLFAVFLFMDLLGRHKHESKLKYFLLSFSILCILLSFFDPFAFLPGLAIASSFSIEEIQKLEKNFNAVLAIFSFLILFASFALFNNFLSQAQSIVISLVIMLISAAVVLLYREANPSKFIVVFILAVILFSSLSYSFLYMANTRGLINRDFIVALNWIKDNTNEKAVVASFGERELIKFTTMRESPDVDAELAYFLLTNSSTDVLTGRNITHLILYADLFDNLEMLRAKANVSRIRLDSFILNGFESDQSGNIYAVFNSSSSKLAFVPIDPRTGIFLDADVMLFYEGNADQVPFRKFMVVDDARGQIYRLIYPQLDSYNINLFKAFFSKVDGLKRVYPEKGGNIIVYEVIG